jgi:hypothetical protein
MSIVIAVSMAGHPSGCLLETVVSACWQMAGAALSGLWGRRADASVITTVVEGFSQASRGRLRRGVLQRCFENQIAHSAVA